MNKIFKKISNILILIIFISIIVIIIHIPSWLIFFNYLEPVTYYEKYASIIGTFSLTCAIIKSLIYLTQTLGGERVATMIKDKCKYLPKKEHDELIGN